MLSTPRSGPQGGCVWKGGSWGRGEEGDAVWDEEEEPSRARTPHPGGPGVSQVTSPVYFCCGS